MTQPTSLLLRALSRLIRLTAYAVVFVMLAVLAIGFVPPVTRLALPAILAFVNSEDQSVAIEDVSGLLTGNLHVRRITLSDRNGPYAEINELGLAWSPFALASGRFDADDLNVGKVSLRRIPVMPPAAEDVPADQTGFSLPVAIAIKRLAIDDLFVAAAIARRDFNLALDGKVTADNEAIDLGLTVRDEARPGAGVDAVLSFHPKDKRLKANLVLAEPRGGLVVGLAGIRGEPSLQIELDGDGPLVDWAGRLAVALDGKPVARLEARHTLSGADRRLEIKGGGALSGLAPDLLRPYVEGDTALHADVTLSGDGAIRIAAAGLKSKQLALTAEGGFDPAGLSDLTINLAPNNGTIALSIPRGESTIAAELGAISLTAFGPADSLDINLKAAVPLISLAEGAVSGTRLTATAKAFDLLHRKGAVELTLAADESRLADEALDRLIAAPLKLTLPLVIDGETLTLNQGTIESATLGGTANGMVDLAGGLFSAHASLFAPGSEVLPPPLSERMPGKLALTADATGTFSGNVTVKTITLSTDALRLSGQAELTDGTIKAAINTDISDLAKLAPDLAGTARIVLNADGPLAGPTIHLALTSEALRSAGRTLSDLSVKLDGKADPAAPEARFEARGDIDGQRIDASGTLASADGVMTLPDLVVAIGRNRLSADLTMPPSGLPAGRLSFDLPDLALMAALAGQKAEGDLKGEAALTTSNGKLAMTLKAQGSGARYGDIVIAAPDIDLAGEDILNGVISGRLKLASLVSGANRVDAVDLSARPDKGATRFDLAAQYDKAPLLVTGQVRQIESGLDIALDRFEAKPRTIPMKLAKATTIALRDGQAKLSGLDLLIGKGLLSLSGTAGQNLDLAVTIRDLPIALANVFSKGLGAAGALSGKIAVKGPAADPAVSYDLNASAVSAQPLKSQGIAALGITAKGNYKALATTMAVGLKNPSGLDLAIKGKVTLAKGPSGDLVITGTVPLALVEPVLAAQGLSAKGSIRLDATVKGALLAPALAGTVKGTGIRVVDVRRNLALNDVQLQMSLEKNRIVLKDVGGTLSSGGTLEARGTVGIQPGSGFPADITLSLKNATYVQGELANATMAGTITVKGPLLAGPKIGGTIRLAKANVTIPEKMPASLAAIDVKHKNASKDIASQAEKIKPKETPKSDTGGLAVDLKITAPGQIFVRGRGLDAELGGTLSMSGNIAAPVVAGGFKMKRGRLTILGKRLDFTSGTIGFGGDLVPSLNLVASTSVNGTTINVTVAGAADNPTISFSSAPALPQDEVLALLIFSRSKGNLSAFQIAQLADAAARLAGGKGGSLVDDIRKNIGVDDLDVTTDEAGNASVKAGKYINKRTYIEVQQGQAPGTGKAVINLDIGKGVKLQGGASTDGTGTAGIVFEKEY